MEADTNPFLCIPLRIHRCKIPNNIIAFRCECDEKRFFVYYPARYYTSNGSSLSGRPICMVVVPVG